MLYKEDLVSSFVDANARHQSRYTSEFFSRETMTCQVFFLILALALIFGKEDI